MLFDEIIAPHIWWSEAPRQVSIALTNVCDLSCRYCFAPKSRAALRVDQILLWLKELDENGTHGIGFGGGEPTLYPNFSKLCELVARQTNLAITFTTHGHHLTEGLIDSLIGNVHFLRVSMDGVGKTYESLRGRPFDNFLKRLGALRRLAPFGINFVVNASTFSDIGVAANLAEQAGASEFLLLPERPVDKRGGIDHETSKALTDWVMSFSGKIRLAVSADFSETLPACDPLPKETGLRAYAHISADGVLKATSFDDDGEEIDERGVMAAVRELKQNIFKNT